MTAPKNQSSDVSSLPESVLDVYRQTNTELYQAEAIHEVFAETMCLRMSSALRPVGLIAYVLNPYAYAFLYVIYNEEDLQNQALRSLNV